MTINCKKQGVTVSIIMAILPGDEVGKLISNFSETTHHLLHSIPGTSRITSLRVFLYYSVYCWEAAKSPCLEPLTST